MNPLRSLRSRVITGMALLIAMVFVIALLGVRSIHALDTSVDQELTLVLQSTDLGNGLVSSVASEVRSAEQYLLRPARRIRLQMLEEGDSAYALQLRYRGLGSLTTSDRYIVNKIAANQAEIEVAYGRDVVDWWSYPNQAAPTAGKLAWEGQNEPAKTYDAKIRLYLTSWKNPHPKKKVVSLDFVATATDTNAVPF